MENIWFYTLSTAAQVLAALAGLFAVFVVWKIQDFDQFFSDARFFISNIVAEAAANTVAYQVITIKELKVISDSEILKKFSELLDIDEQEPSRIKFRPSERTSDSLITYAFDRSTELFFRKFVNNKQSTLNLLKIVLVSNFLTISVCLSALLFTQFFCNQTVLVVICSFVIACLFLIGNSIYRISTK